MRYMVRTQRTSIGLLGDLVDIDHPIGQIKISHISSEDQKADIFTKPLIGDKYQKALDMLGVQPRITTKGLVTFSAMPASSSSEPMQAPSRPPPLPPPAEDEEERGRRSDGGERVQSQGDGHHFQKNPHSPQCLARVTHGPFVL
eukprot:6465153-Amphidinium_carterae.1